MVFVLSMEDTKDTFSLMNVHKSFLLSLLLDLEGYNSTLRDGL